MHNFSSLQIFRFRALYNEYCENFSRDLHTENGSTYKVKLSDRLDVQRLQKILVSIDTSTIGILTSVLCFNDTGRSHRLDPHDTSTQRNSHFLYI